MRSNLPKLKAEIVWRYWKPSPHIARRQWLLMIFINKLKYPEEKSLKFEIYSLYLNEVRKNLAINQPCLPYFP